MNHLQVIIIILLTLPVLINNSKSFGLNSNHCTRNVEIMVPLKYLSNFWRTLDMLLLNCEINLILPWSEKCVIASNTAANKATIFAITDTKLYVPVVTLSTQNNTKLLQQLTSGFKRTINWNRYQSKVTTQAPIPYSDNLIDPSLKGVSRLFVLLFENTTDRTVHQQILYANCINKGL